MKWHSTRISELISGYGELWSTQILTLLLNMRVHSQDDDDVVVVVTENQREHHRFVYLDARRVITVDETSGPGSSSNSNSSSSNSSSSNSGNSHGSTSSVVCWDISQAKLQQVYQEEYSALLQQQQEEEPQRQGPIKLQSYYELRVRYEHSSINFNCVRSY